MTLILSKVEELKSKLGGAWYQELESELKSDYIKKLNSFLAEEKKELEIYPPNSDIFNAFTYCPLDKLKVVILGQDPYHGPGQAHGLCFSVREGVKPPPSLLNIFKELEATLSEFQRPQKNDKEYGELSSWAQQGVFLLNTCLSVRAHQAGSHFNQGWEIFTDKVIEIINEKKSNVVFMLWGAPARKKASMIDKTKHLILEAPHPSPLSAHRGFFGSNHFNQANEYLSANGLDTIDWNFSK